TLVVAPIAGVFYLVSHPDLFAAGIGEALVKSGDSYVSLTGAAKGFGAGMLITGGFSWFFGYLGGQPQLSLRFMAIKDAKQAKKARNIGIAWTIIAYVGALMIGWIGIALFGPAGLSDPEYVMPSVVMTLFHPVLAALLITGAIAAMISTADSLLILSATELSENIFRKQKTGVNEQGEGSLKRHRITTAAIAVIALFLSYISPSKLIFTIVSYVWAGIGCTFSVVILFSLFCRRFHGLAAVITIISGIVFTIFWISGGFEQHYRVTEEKTQFLISQNIIRSDQAALLYSLEGKKFVNQARFENALRENLDETDEKDLPVITTSYMKKGVPARLTTFLFALLAALVSTFLIPPRNPSRP
ncbi:MAG TPA: hypothetical protein PLE95_02980, partial [Bacteroidales bacterium]|nr:hypothetical protein [Bacteroidales bacterium]